MTQPRATQHAPRSRLPKTPTSNIHTPQDHCAQSIRVCDLWCLSLSLSFHLPLFLSLCLFKPQPQRLPLCAKLLDTSCYIQEHHFRRHGCPSFASFFLRNTQASSISLKLILRPMKLDVVVVRCRGDCAIQAASPPSTTATTAATHQVSTRVGFVHICLLVELLEAPRVGLRGHLALVQSRLCRVEFEPSAGCANDLPRSSDGSRCTRKDRRPNVGASIS